MEAPEDFKQLADQYWIEKILPWIRQRTKAFRKAVPTARIIELDSPYHHIFLDKENETAEAIREFLKS